MNAIILGVVNCYVVVNAMYGGSASDWLVAAVVEGVFVIVHPHLEYSFIDSNLTAEVAHVVLVALLKLPPDTVGELVHLLFLSLAELRPEPLARAWSKVVSGEVVGGEVEI